MGDKNILIIGISGSPRGIESRSEELLVDFLADVRAQGVDTDFIRLADYKISPCEGCYSKGEEFCTFPCIHDQDDTNYILEKIRHADGLVLATPIHWAGPSSLLKLLLDKMTALENNQHKMAERDGVWALAGKPFVLIASQEGDGAAMALSQINWALTHMGMHCVPYGMVFEPAALQKKVIRMGLCLMGEKRFEWVYEMLWTTARLIVFYAKASRELAKASIDWKNHMPKKWR